MAKIKLQFSIPDWLYRFRYENVKNYLSYQLNPYRCDHCNVKMPMDHFDIFCDAKYPLKRKLGISYHGTNFKEIICPDCLRKRVHKTVTHKDFPRIIKTNSHYDLNVRKSCDCCGEDKPSFKFFYFDERKGVGDRLHFCLNSWNGSYVCLDCIDTALKFGEMTSSMWQYHAGYSYMTNKRGLPVINNKVIFPLK